MAEAFAKAITTGTCGKCHSAAETIAYAIDDIYVSATAEIITDIDGYADGGEVNTDVTIMVKAYEEATLDAFAQAIVEAKGDDDECYAYSKSVAKAGDESAVCVLNTGAASATHVDDAVAEVLASVSDKVCYAESSVSVTVSATVCPILTVL